MTDTQKFLIVVTVVMSVWQAFILVMAASYVRAGYQNVKFGVLPGIIAAVTGTIAWLL